MAGGARERPGGLVKKRPQFVKIGFFEKWPLLLWYMVRVFCLVISRADSVDIVTGGIFLKLGNGRLMIKISTMFMSRVLHRYLFRLSFHYCRIGRRRGPLLRTKDGQVTFLTLPFQFPRGWQMNYVPILNRDTGHLCPHSSSDNLHRIVVTKIFHDPEFPANNLIINTNTSANRKQRIDFIKQIPLPFRGDISAVAIKETHAPVSVVNHSRYGKIMANFIILGIKIAVWLSKLPIIGDWKVF